MYRKCQYKLTTNLTITFISHVERWYRSRNTQLYFCETNGPHVNSTRISQDYVTTSHFSVEHCDVKAISPTARGITLQNGAKDCIGYSSVVFQRAVRPIDIGERWLTDESSGRIILYRGDASRGEVFLKIHKRKDQPPPRSRADNGEKGRVRKAAFLTRRILAKMDDRCSRESRKGKDCEEGKEVS